MIKKAALCISALALLTTLLVTAMDQASRYPTTLYAKPARIAEIRSTRQETPAADGTEELPVPDLRINGTALFYDRLSATFYYSLTDDRKSWPDFTFTLEGVQPEGRLCFTRDFMQESRSEVLEASSRIPFLIYDNETYQSYYLTFSTLPLMQIRLHELPEEVRIHETLKDGDDTTRLPQDVLLDYDVLLAEDAPIRREDSYATVTLFDPRGEEDDRKYGEVFLSEARLHVRGRSSVNYPKNSFRMELLVPDEKDPSLLIENKVPLLGMRKDGDWVLNALYAEPTKIREKLAAEVWMAMNEDVETVGEAAGYRVEYIEVFIDDTYWGLYGLSERVDAKMLGLTSSENPAGSDLLYWSIADKDQEWTGYSQPETPYYSGGYELRFPDIISEPSADWWRPFGQLVRAAREKELDDRAVEFSAIADVNSAINYYLFIQAVSGVDNVIQNTYFLYRAETGKFTFLPWDLDQTFGNVWQGEMPRLTGEDYNTVDWFRPWWVTQEMFDENAGEMLSLLRNRLRTLRRGVLDEKAMVRRIDAIEKQLDASGVLTREGNRWPQGGHNSHTGALRQFVVARLIRLDSQVRRMAWEGGWQS
ncbi:MAG: hypothetical protein HFJ80_05395 [Clostridiales bacterium]|nr:hypothetical protein [Clostridiales bacterium]